MILIVRYDEYFGRLQLDAYHYFEKDRKSKKYIYNTHELKPYRLFLVLCL